MDSFFFKKFCLAPHEGTPPDIYEASDNVDTNEAYVVVDAKIGYQYNDKYSIYVYGKNILDEEYYTSFDSEGGPGDQEIGLPQSFGVVLDYKF